MRSRSSATIAALALAASVAGGCKARTPGKLEKAVAAQVKLRLTVGGRGDTNPLPATDAEVDRGRRAFASYCSVCHGLDGQKTGVPFADAMSPPIPSLRSPEIQAYTDGQLKWIVENGLFPSGMPAARGLLSDDEMWRIVVYLRHLPPVGSLGDPPAYGGSPVPAPAHAAAGVVGGAGVTGDQAMPVAPR